MASKRRYCSKQRNDQHRECRRGSSGIENQGTFTNKTGGLITVDDVGDIGIYQEGGVFTNEATIKIGSTGDVATTGISSSAVFNNTASGQITIDRVWYKGFQPFQWHCQ